MALVLLPPILAGLAELAGFEAEPAVGRWLRRIPIAYPATASLGAGVLLMVAISPFLIVQRVRAKRVVLQVPLVQRPGKQGESVIDAIGDALAMPGSGRSAARGSPARGRGRSARWASRAATSSAPSCAASRIGCVDDELEVMSYATNVAILGPERTAHRARAAIERRLAFHDAYLTWSPESQELEEVLFELRGSHAPSDEVAQLLDRFRARLDATTLNADEWNVLERLRLQLAEETHARRAGARRAGADAPRDARAGGVRGR